MVGKDWSGWNVKYGVIPSDAAAILFHFKAATGDTNTDSADSADGFIDTFINAVQVHVIDHISALRDDWIAAAAAAADADADADAA
jgi:hypothetical protein